MIEREVPQPLRDDVVVALTTIDGARLESPLMPGISADIDRVAIEMRRDRAFNHDMYDVPGWLPDGFDFASVDEVETIYRGPP